MWIEVCSSEQVALGQVVAVEPAGQRVALWRTASGTLVAVDARCPHQWADLATQGDVEGEELICGVHGWRFGVDGSGTKQAMNGRVDPKAPVACFAVRERRGLVELEVEGDGR